MNPVAARPGDTVTVQAPDAGCNPRYGQNARIQVTVTDASNQEIINTTAPMNDAGGFSFQFTVPLHVAPGQAAVEAYPYEVDWCDDTGRNNRAAQPSGLTRTSCAARTEALTITP